MLFQWGKGRLCKSKSLPLDHIFENWNSLTFPFMHIHIWTLFPSRHRSLQRYTGKEANNNTQVGNFYGFNTLQTLDHTNKRKHTPHQKVSKWLQIHLTTLQSSLTSCPPVMLLILIMDFTKAFSNSSLELANWETNALVFVVVSRAWSEENRLLPWRRSL